MLRSVLIGISHACDNFFNRISVIVDFKYRCFIFFSFSKNYTDGTILKHYFLRMKIYARIYHRAVCKIIQSLIELQFVYEKLEDKKYN